MCIYSTIFSVPSKLTLDKEEDILSREDSASSLTFELNGGTRGPNGGAIGDCKCAREDECENEEDED